MVKVDYPKFYYVAEVSKNFFASVNIYRIQCGLSRTDLSYHDCDAINLKTKFGQKAGSTESIQLQLSLKGVTVYFAIIAYDSSGNASPLSNVASAFAPGQTTWPTDPSSKFPRRKLTHTPSQVNFNNAQKYKHIS